jgi:hypothetical protein
MLRRVVILAALLVALVAVDRSQRDAAAERRQDALRVRAFVGAEQREGKSVAVVRVQDGDGKVHLYGRQDALWRCLDYRAAPALGDKIEQLISGLYEAQGVVLSEHPQQPHDYGLDVPSMRTISLHGAKMDLKDPASDVVVAIDVGAAVVGADGCYARVHGERAIWTIDVDPGAITGREPSARPSLIDPALVPAAWPGVSPRLQTIRVARPGQPAYQLAMRAREISPEEAMQGVPGFEWILTRGDGPEQPTAFAPAVGYSSHLLAAPWVEVVDSALAPTLGFDAPRAEVTLTGGGGDPCRLVLGGRTPSGRLAVLDSVSRLVYEVDPAEEALLFPPAEAFDPAATANPWDTRPASPAAPQLSLPPR